MSPSPRTEHRGAWTGTELAIWGGLSSGSLELGDGACYAPLADTWRVMRLTGAPAPRSRHALAWTGSLLVVWGGQRLGSPLADGGSYDPASDAWHPVSATGAPGSRADHTATWTGTEVLVWGGVDGGGSLASGGAYDPVLDTWRPMASVGAPTARGRHTAVWTGTHLLVWGGEPYTTAGGRYHPGTDTWQPMATGNAPTPRSRHVAAWSGVEMLVWGGRNALLLPTRDGGRYDPSTDSWQRMSVAGAPAARADHSGVWTGNRLIVWGGADDVETLHEGGAYDPVTDTWACPIPSGALYVGRGAGPAAAYGADIEGYLVDGSDSGISTNPFPGLLGHGVRHAAADLSAPLPDEILAAPGPSPALPPRIRGVDSLGLPLPGLDFLAYGTGGFGANPGAGPIDARVEILTGPGPSSTFGPHVRAFGYAAGTVTPLAKVSFYAYGTLRHGVHVAPASVDPDAFAEILTGPGPGAVFGPHVRGFDYDGLAVAALAKLSFFAYGTLRYGVRVAGGDVDADGFEEVVTGPGPSAAFGPQVRGFDADGGAATPIPGINAFAFLGSRYGAMPAAGDLDVDGVAEIAAGAGPDPGFGSRVTAFRFAAGSLTEIAALAMDPFGLAYGATVSVGDL